MQKIINTDINLFLYLNSRHSPFWDEVMWWMSDKWIMLPLYAVILFFIIRNFRWQSAGIVVFILILVVLTDQTSVHLFKNIFERLRPCHNPEIADMVHQVNNKCGGKYGFVSSHATNSFGFAMFTTLLFRKWYFSAFILLWALVVSYSRIYLGVHYPGDVLGGILLGSLLACIMYIIMMHIKKKMPNFKFL